MKLVEIGRYMWNFWEIWLQSGHNTTTLSYVWGPSVYNLGLRYLLFVRLFGDNLYHTEKDPHSIDVGD